VILLAIRFFRNVKEVRELTSEKALTEIAIHLMIQAGTERIRGVAATAAILDIDANRLLAVANQLSFIRVAATAGQNQTVLELLEQNLPESYQPTDESLPVPDSATPEG
jgi:hypothetical protein